MSNNNVVLALDIGSSSIRCSAYEYADLLPALDGDQDQNTFKRLCTASRKLSAIQPNTGKIRCAPLLEAVDSCVDDCLSKLRELMRQQRPFNIVAVAIASFVMNMIAVNSQGEFISDEMTLSYACNSDAVVKEILQVQTELGEESCRTIYQKTGAPIHSAYAIAQLRVLYNDDAATAVHRSITNFTTIASFCITRWINSITNRRMQISYSEASWTGLLNWSSCQYEEMVLRLLPDECVSALPELADFDSILSKGIPVDSPYYNKWPELRNVRWFLGVGDGATANIGSKCTIPQRIACTVGTSAAARVIVRMPVVVDTDGSATPADELKMIPSGLFCYRINKEYCLVGGALTDGASVVEWLRQLLNMASQLEFERCLSAVEKLMEEDMEQKSKVNLVTVPFLNGERSTEFRSNAKGAILGLTRETTPAHLLKSFLEGVTLRISAIIDLIRIMTNDTDLEPKIIASGKALESNKLWRQMISDCTGLPVIFDDETQEATSRGIVYLVAHAINCNGNNIMTAGAVHSTSECRPRPQAQAYWRRVAKAQDDLIDAVTPLF